jgi:RNA polymerase sigma-70 factor (ECF subfamily)
MDEAGTFSTAADRRTLERDEELALEARSDPHAFGVLYQRHRLAVFRYLRTRTASEDDAAELTAITFERALTAMARYRSSGGGVLAWLLRIARNAAIDAGRRTSTVPMLADVADVRATSSPEAAVLDAEAQSALAEAVNRLPDVQREALGLRYAAGLTAREIGAVIGKSEQATQKLMSRALATLREEHRHDR